MSRTSTLIASLSILVAAAAAAEPAVAVDNAYYEWQNLPAVARFADQYTPYYFGRETGGKRSTLTIDRSLYWGRGGTQIREIKGILDGGSLYLYVTTNGALSPEVSVFGYVHVGRQPGTLNRYTLELMPSRRGGGGFVALWVGDGAVTEAGELANSGSALEGRIDLAKVPPELVSAAGEVSIDVTTCYHEAAAGSYEEFYFTTLYLADLTAAR